MIKPEERNSGNEDLLVYCKNFPLLLLLFDIMKLKAQSSCIDVHIITYVCIIDWVKLIIYQWE